MYNCVASSEVRRNIVRKSDLVEFFRFRRNYRRKMARTLRASSSQSAREISAGISAAIRRIFDSFVRRAGEKQLLRAPLVALLRPRAPPSGAPLIYHRDGKRATRREVCHGTLPKTRERRVVTEHRNDVTTSEHSPAKSVYRILARARIRANQISSPVWRGSRLRLPPPFALMSPVISRRR